MPNQTVTLMRRCKTESGWKFYPAAVGKNGRIRPDFAIINGKQVEMPEGHYTLRFYEGRKLRYENAGTNAAQALNLKFSKEKRLKAQNAAQDAGATLVEVPGRVYLRKAAGLYVKDKEGQGAMEAARYAELVTGEFIAECGRTFLDEVTREDIFAYHNSLRKQGCSDRTVSNKHQRLASFLRFAGLDVKTIMPPKPKYEKELPTVYTNEQLSSLLGAADKYMRLVIELGMKCGLREQELVYLEWPDINWQDKILRVQGKTHWEFKVKDSEQRDIPIPDDLLKALKARHKDHHKQRLVLGTEKGNPNNHLLRQLKRMVNRAGLKCGVCEGCKGKVRECQDWTLHKLRRTYATTLLRNGIDLRTVQNFMGHADLASTSRYLRPAGSRETQSAISGIFAKIGA